MFLTFLLYKDIKYFIFFVKVEKIMEHKKIDSAYVSLLKSKINLVDIIGERIRLEKRGRAWWANCPFHHEKTPSFIVNENEQYYHCYGCGESGDVIAFLRKYENWSYIEALRYLSEKAKMPLPDFQVSEDYAKIKQQRDKAIRILNIAREVYKQNIYSPKAKIAQDYLKKRKVGRRELEGFELGYSISPFDITNILRDKGFSNEDMKLAGICEIGKSGKPYDLFSERLMFPIVNIYGDCIGFSGRDLTGDARAKYKNSPSTAVFDKSKTIYAINLISELKKTQPLNNIILVEGQFDVITMHHYGFRNTVACLGTAFTSEHIKQLKRFSDNLILCFDGDEAGQKATLRTLNVLDGSGMNVKVCTLPANTDPDEFLEKFGADKLKEKIENAISPMDYKILNTKTKYDISTNEGKSGFIKDILKQISAISSSSEQEIYLKEIQKITGVSVDILRRDITTTSTKDTSPPKNLVEDIELPRTMQDGTIKAMQFVLASLLFKKPYANITINLEPYIINPTLRQLYKLIKEHQNQGKTLIISNVFDHFDDQDKPILQAVIGTNFEVIDDQEKYFTSCLWQVVEHELKFRKSELSKQYMTEENPELRRKIILEITQIDTQLKNKNLGDC